MFDPKAFRQYLDSAIEQHPELFPAAIRQGYKLHDVLPESKKMPGIRLRRIELHTGSVFTIRPSFVMSYMTGYTDDVEKPLFLRRWGVPHWALAYVFGRDEQYWYRLENRLGRNSVVGTTVKDPDKMSKDLLADEKHTRFNGEKAYSATGLTNTTLAVVATNGYLTKEAANKVAQMAHDGLARSIRPVHTMFDGDIVFTLATGKPPKKGIGAVPSVVGTAAAEVLTQAVVQAARQAESLGGVPAACDLKA